MEWIMIVDRAGADIYKFSEANGLQLLKEYPNPLGRLRNSAMQKGPPGRSRAKYKGSAPHSLNKDPGPHEEAAEQFVRELSDSVKVEMKKNVSLKLRVVAEAGLLGKFRKYFEDAFWRERVQWVEKSLKNVPPKKWPNLIGLNATLRPRRFSKRLQI